MNRNYLVVVLYFVFLSSPVFGQESDLSGTWEGTYSWLNKNHPYHFELTQDGKKVTGTASTSSKDSSTYYLAKVEGTVKGKRLTLKAMKFIKKKGGACLSNMDLSIVVTNQTMLLEGRWKPALRPGGCLVGASGRVSMVKKVALSTNTAPIVVAENDTKDLEEDALAREMYEGLKKREYHALIIGVSDYIDKSMNDLEHAVNDGNKLKKVLSSSYNFPEGNITMLSNPSRTQILDAMESLSNDLDSKDNLLIFFAGHGIWNDKLEQGYWLPSDATVSSKANWISNSTIRDYIRSINSRHTLLISDACFSGGILKHRNVENGKAMMNVYNLPSRKAITSGTLTTVPDKSVFMEYFLKYLRDNQQALLSADQIFYQTKVSVINNSPNSQVPQYGPIHQAKDEGGEFVFLKVGY